VPGGPGRGEWCGEQGSKGEAAVRKSRDRRGAERTPPRSPVSADLVRGGRWGILGQRRGRPGLVEGKGEVGCQQGTQVTNKGGASGGCGERGGVLNIGEKFGAREEDTDGGGVQAAVPDRA